MEKKQATKSKKRREEDVLKVWIRQMIVMRRFVKSAGKSIKMMMKHSETHGLDVITVGDGTIFFVLDSV